jgi:hypothetical protein
MELFTPSLCLQNLFRALWSIMDHGDGKSVITPKMSLHALRLRMQSEIDDRLGSMIGNPVHIAL